MAEDFDAEIAQKGRLWMGNWFIKYLSHRIRALGIGGKQKSEKMETRIFFIPADNGRHLCLGNLPAMCAIGNEFFQILGKQVMEWTRANDEAEKILEGKKWPSFLGSAGFAEWIKAQFYQSKTDDEVPQAKDLVPDAARITREVSEFYGIPEAHLYSSRRGLFNEPRNVAVYLARRLRRDTLSQLCIDFSINKYSSVSSIISRVEQRMGEDEKLKENINQIRAIIKKSQGQI